jgi:hypothetical protein
VTEAVYYPPEVRVLNVPQAVMPQAEANARRKRAVDLVQRVFHALENEGLERYNYASPAEMWRDIHKRAQAILTENNRAAGARLKLARLADDEVLGLREVAFMLGMSTHGLRKRIHNGHDHPPYIRYGDGPQARYVFNKAGVRRWLKSQEIKAKVGRPKKRRPVATTKKGPKGAAPVHQHPGHRPGPLQGTDLWPAGSGKDHARQDGQTPWPDPDSVG